MLSMHCVRFDFVCGIGKTAWGKKDHPKFSVPHSKVVLPTCKRITFTLRESIHKVKMKMSPETYPATVRIIITLHPIRIDVFHIYSSFY